MSVEAGGLREYKCHSHAHSWTDVHGAVGGGIQARALAPAIIFIDEIDAVGRIRGGAMGNDERDQTLNQMLSEMDGFNDGGPQVVVMGATNRLDVLDPALVRPGRFDRIVYVDRPDFDGRIEVIKVHLRWDDPDRCRAVREIDFAEISSATNRFSGAALANLVNSAAMLAARDARDLITNQVLPKYFCPCC
eukprot:jgi/Botrbrau1/14083/Bobra.182_3s0030.1